MGNVEVIREVHPAAKIAPDVEIGPYCVVGPDVTIGPGTRLVRRVAVVGRTTIGSGNTIEDGCVLGAAPQDLKYAGGPTLLIIGHRNRFERDVTAHIGTELGGALTRIGDDNLLRAGCHVAHDCYVDDHTVLGRDVLLAGHVRIEAGAVIGDMVGAHHFTTVGRHARVAARTPVRRDVPPYTEFACDAAGEHPAVCGVHEAGIRAASLPPDEAYELRRCLSELFEDEAALQTKIEQLVTMGVEGQAAMLCDFVQKSLRGVYGRHREMYRGKPAPEAARYLPPDVKAELRRVRL
jgi:UDP-N-acetylglucosamine acyltransferase